MNPFLKEAQTLWHVLDEILNYSGGAEDALSDEYVMERAYAALKDTQANIIEFR